MVQESDVCAACHTGRTRGSVAGCEVCHGRCCYAGVRVRLCQSIPHTHHLAAFKGCDGWLQGRLQPGRWAVLFQGATAALPVSVGAGGVYQVCYAPPRTPLSRHLDRTSAEALARRTPRRRQGTNTLYFGEQLSLRECAALGVLVWREKKSDLLDLLREQPVLPHTARAGAAVTVSRAWCRAPAHKAGEARYGKFVSRAGVLTRPAVGGSWYMPILLCLPR